MAVHDLFTKEARASICSYFAPISREPLSVMSEAEPVTTDKIGYAFRFVIGAERKVTDARVWMCLVAEIIKCEGAIGTIPYNSVLDIVCVDESDAQNPSIRFIEPFFTNRGRQLLCQHHGVVYRGPQPKSGSRDSDLWFAFVRTVFQAKVQHDATILGKFLVGPYAMLTSKGTV